MNETLTLYKLMILYLLKKVDFPQTSCIIQTGFSSFESIQTKILEEIEGIACTVNVPATGRIQQQFCHLTH